MPHLLCQGSLCHLLVDKVTPFPIEKMKFGSECSILKKESLKFHSTSRSPMKAWHTKHSSEPHPSPSSLSYSKESSAQKPDISQIFCFFERKVSGFNTFTQSVSASNSRMKNSRWSRIVNIFLQTTSTTSLYFPFICAEEQNGVM